jgi:tryptophan synthase alpha chain
MTMLAERYSRCFARLRRQGDGAFVPFTVLGDPDPETSLEVLRAFVEGGADMLELGIPFSDPIADGPTIQGADCRALAGGTTPPAALELVARFREEHPDIPIGLLVYANLVYGPGLERFYSAAAAAGVDSVLVADLPLEESGPFTRAARRAGVAPVFMVTPLSGRERLQRITAQAAPYLYVVSRSGVTGQDRRLAETAGRLLGRLRELESPPPLLGFGIGAPQQVREALAAGAAGAISGSAIVKIIERHVQGASLPLEEGRREALIREVRELVAAMKSATRGGLSRR